VYYENMVSKSATFSSRLARILFGTPPRPGKAEEEQSIVSRMRAFLTSAPRDLILKRAAYIDASVCTVLSGESLRHLAEIIELTCPDAIEKMETLRANQGHLRVAYEYAEHYSPEVLDRVIAALEAEARANF